MHAGMIEQHGGSARSREHCEINSKKKKKKEAETKHHLQTFCNASLEFV
jgi:hypothetical protein